MIPARILPVLIVAVGIGAASAQERMDPSPEVKPDNFRRLSLTISPLHLALPMLEITAEYMALPNLGLAAVGGLGSVSVTENFIDGTSEKIKFSAQEAGAQLRFYPFRSHPHGLQLGGELLWLHLSGHDLAGTSGTGAGVAVGPFLGYKYTSSIGFTFDSQIGYEFLSAQGQSSNSGATNSTKDSSGIPLLNLNVGWSI